MHDPEPFRRLGEVFPAKITAKTFVSSHWRYSWTEQYINPTTGLLADAQPAASGDSTLNPAFEVNDAGIDLTTPIFAYLRFRGMLSGQPCFDFVNPLIALNGEYQGVGPTFPLSSVGTASYLRVCASPGGTNFLGEAILDTGLRMVNLGNEFQITLADASVAQGGGVIVGEQAFTGLKHFVNALSVATGNAPATSSSSGVTGTIAWDGSFIYVCTSTGSWKRVALSSF